MWASPCKNMSSGIRGQWGPRSACASAQSDQVLHCPLTELFKTTECINGEQRPGFWKTAILLCPIWQDGLNQCLLYMFEDTFSFDKRPIRDIDNWCKYRAV